MTSDRGNLERFRDHARQRADWQPGEPRPACRDRTAFGTPKPADHANCGGGRCGCSCHAPTDAERALWGRLADEVDAHLTGGTCPGCGQPRRDDDDGAYVLFVAAAHTCTTCATRPDATLEGTA